MREVKAENQKVINSPLLSGTVFYSCQDRERNCLTAQGDAEITTHGHLQDCRASQEGRLNLEGQVLPAEQMVDGYCPKQQQTQQNCGTVGTAWRADNGRELANSHAS